MKFIMLVALSIFGLSTLAGCTRSDESDSADSASSAE